MGKMIDFLFKHMNESFYVYGGRKEYETEVLNAVDKDSNCIGYINTMLGALFLFKEATSSKYFIPIRENNYVSSDEIIALMMISEVAI